MSSFTPTFAAPQSLHPGCPGLLAAQRRTCEAEPRPITAAVWNPWNFTAGDGWATYRPRASWVDICIHVNYVDAVAALKLILLSLNFRVHTCRNCSRWASPNIPELAHTNLQANDIETLFFFQTSSNVIPNHFFGPMLLIVGAQLRVQSPPRCDWPTGSHTLAAAPEDWSDFTCAQFRRNTRPCGWKSWKSQHKNAHVMKLEKCWCFAKYGQGTGPLSFPIPKESSNSWFTTGSDSRKWGNMTRSSTSRVSHLEHTPLLAGPDTCDARSPRMPDECWPLHGLKVGAFHLQQEQSITASGSPVIQSKVYSSRAGIIIRMKHSRWRPSEHP